MKKGIRLLYVVGMILRLDSFGQGLSGGVENQNNLNQIASTGDPTQVIRQYDERYAGVKGSPYLLEEFNPGKVKLKSGKLYFSQFINYDCVHDELVFKKDAASPEMIVKRELIENFQIDSTLTSPISRRIAMLNLPNQPQGFYEILYEGDKVRIYQRTVKKIGRAHV